MALVKKIEKIEKQRNYVHNEVECTYTTFTDSIESKYFQIDTYGSVSRQFRDKVSQSIQLDKESAEKLVKLITTHMLK